jgi:predicted PilT family ATPase
VWLGHVFLLVILTTVVQADETSEILKIPAQYHSSLIGQNGKYAIRLEEKYSVKITFPRQTSENGEGRTREQLKADEVLVKGGKKGVAGAKSELLEVRGHSF